MMLLVLAWFACGTDPVPATAPEPAPPAPVAEVVPAPPVEAEAPASEPEAPDGDVMYELVVSLPGGLATGTRVWTGGVVELGGGTPDDLTWSPHRTLTTPVLDQIAAELASPGVAALPTELPVPPGAREDGASATWTIRVDGRERVVSAPAYATVRVPAFDRVEDLVRAPAAATGRRTRWTLGERAGGPRTFELPCDPGHDASFRALLHAMRAQDLPAASADRPSEVLVRVDFLDGTRPTSHVLGVDGRLFVSTSSGTEAFQTPTNTVTRVTRTAGKLNEARAAAACR